MLWRVLLSLLQSYKETSGGFWTTDKKTGASNVVFSWESIASQLCIYDTKTILFGMKSCRLTNIYMYTPMHVHPPPPPSTYTLTDHEITTTPSYAYNYRAHDNSWTMHKSG